ncbi:MAG: endonuclease III [bacterium]|nr:endonuclease III [bacterium]
MVKRTLNIAQRALEIDERFARSYPDAECELIHADPWQLLVATVLSAQCTDERVNQVTPHLFELWPTVGDLAAADVADLEEAIRTTGLFRNKAKALVESARRVMANHGGVVPAEMAALTSLPGVGRKTAKVVLGTGFGVVAGIAVDTHVGRIARRTGLSTANDPERVARDLESLFPRSSWISFSLRTIQHGRRVCSARTPSCEECVLESVCLRVGVRGQAG